jgi:hypothetical protein
MTASMSCASATSSYGVKYPSAKFWHDTKANVTLRTIELPGGRCGCGPRADPVADLEAVEVLVLRAEPVDLLADAVRLVGQRHAAALADDRVEVLVL